MITIISQFIHHIDHDQDETGNTYCKTNNIDQGVGFSLDKIPDGSPEKVNEHIFSL